MEVTVSFPILSLLLGLPLLGAVLLMLLPKEEKGLLRAAATLSAGLSFVMSLVLVAYTGVPDPAR